MKKIVIIVFAIVFSFHSASAQSGFGVMADVNVSRSTKWAALWKTGGNLGAFYDAQFCKWFYVQPRLMLGYQENEFKKYMVTDEFTDYYSQWNVQLPVLASFVLFQNDDSQLRLNAGPYAQYAVFGRVRHASYSYDPAAEGVPLSSNGTSLDWWHESFNEKFTYGVQAGIQFGYKHFLVSIDYKYALKRSLLNLKGHEQAVLVGLGYKF